jgi:uncharacterized membrane protein YfcA
VVLIPLLLYVPPLLGVGQLDVRSVAGITMAQVFVASLVGLLAHWRHQVVNRRLMLIGGLSMATGSFVGALASKLATERVLLIVFALMVTGGLLVMLFATELERPAAGEPARFSGPRTATVAGGVGLGGGLVGAGGAFLLVPLLLTVVRVPIRIAIGTSLGILTLAATAGFLGKLLTGQILAMEALAVVAGAIPGAHLGAALSVRMSGARLKLVLTALIGAVAARVWWDVLSSL